MTGNRRSFLKGIGIAAAASALGGCKANRCKAGGAGTSAAACGIRLLKGEKLKFGAIGAGGKGWTDWRNMLWHGELPVAICDVDQTAIDMRSPRSARKASTPPTSAPTPTTGRCSTTRRS